MGMFQLFKKKEILTPLKVSDDAIVAMADGELIDVSTVSDPAFSKKLLGDSIAFAYSGDSVVVCAPANGVLSVLFPTGHAFGIIANDGVELLVHIGVDTVNANGDGFEMLNHKQGDHVSAGDPIVRVNLKKLSKTYDMATMLIITNANEKKIQFIEPQAVKRGQSVIR